MSVAAFLTAALESALDNGMGTPEDVLRHATPDVIAAHVPRPVWARLLAACLAAPRTDARLVVDTVGIATLCQHVPHPIMYACLAELALRALGRGLVAAPPPSATSSTSTTVISAPPAAARSDHRAPTAPAPAEAAPSASSASSSAAAASSSSSGNGRTPVPAEPEPLGDPPAAPARAAVSTRPTPLGRRPQAPAQPPPMARAEGTRNTPLSTRRRATSATDFDVETDVGEAWKRPDAVPVDDDQLIDWAQAEETATKNDKYGKH